MFDNNKKKKPYPSVMIWRYKNKDGRRVITDMEEEDTRIIRYAVDTYLR